MATREIYCKITPVKIISAGNNYGKITPVKNKPIVVKKYVIHPVQTMICPSNNHSGKVPVNNENFLVNYEKVNLNMLKKQSLNALSCP